MWTLIVIVLTGTGGPNVNAGQANSSVSTAVVFESEKLCDQARDDLNKNKGSITTNAVFEVRAYCARTK